MIVLQEDGLRELAQFFRVLGDPTRLRILRALRSGPVCVHELWEALDLEQSTVSHQLRVLKSARLVKYRREGRHVYYELNDSHVVDILDRGAEHVTEP